MAQLPQNPYQGLRTLDDALAEGPERFQEISSRFHDLARMGADRDLIRREASRLGYAPLAIDPSGKQVDLTDYVARRADMSIGEHIQDVGAGFARGFANIPADIASLAAIPLQAAGSSALADWATGYRQGTSELIPTSNKFRTTTAEQVGGGLSFIAQMGIGGAGLTKLGAGVKIAAGANEAAVAAAKATAFAKNSMRVATTISAGSEAGAAQAQGAGAGATALAALGGAATAQLERFGSGKVLGELFAGAGGKIGARYTGGKAAKDVAAGFFGEMGEELVAAPISVAARSGYEQGSYGERLGTELKQTLKVAPLAIMPFTVAHGMSAAQMVRRDTQLQKALPDIYKNRQGSLKALAGVEEGQEIKKNIRTSDELRKDSPELADELDDLSRRTGRKLNASSAGTQRVAALGQMLTDSGMRVVYYEDADAAAGGSDTPGHYDPNTATAYINTALPENVQVMQGLVHEVLHDLHKDSPGGLATIHERLKAAFGDTYTNYMKRVAAAYPDAAEGSQNLTEEQVNNFLTQGMAGYMALAFTNQDVFKYAAYNDPGLIANVADTFSRFLGLSIDKYRAKDQEILNTRLENIAAELGAQYGADPNVAGIKPQTAVRVANEVTLGMQSALEIRREMLPKIREALLESGKTFVSVRTGAPELGVVGNRIERYRPVSGFRIGGEGKNAEIRRLAKGALEPEEYRALHDRSDEASLAKDIVVTSGPDSGKVIAKAGDKLSPVIRKDLVAYKGMHSGLVLDNTDLLWRYATRAIRLDAVRPFMREYRALQAAYQAMEGRKIGLSAEEEAAAGKAVIGARARGYEEGTKALYEQELTDRDLAELKALYEQEAAAKERLGQEEYERGFAALLDEEQNRLKAAQALVEAKELARQGAMDEFHAKATFLLATLKHIDKIRSEFTIESRKFEAERARGERPELEVLKDYPRMVQLGTALAEYYKLSQEVQQLAGAGYQVESAAQKTPENPVRAQGVRPRGEVVVQPGETELRAEVRQRELERAQDVQGKYKMLSQMSKDIKAFVRRLESHQPSTDTLSGYTYEKVNELSSRAMEIKGEIRKLRKYGGRTKVNEAAIEAAQIRLDLVKDKLSSIAKKYGSDAAIMESLRKERSVAFRQGGKPLPTPPKRIVTKPDEGEGPSPMGAQPEGPAPEGGTPTETPSEGEAKKKVEGEAQPEEPTAEQTQEAIAQEEAQAEAETPEAAQEAIAADEEQFQPQGMPAELFGRLEKDKGGVLQSPSGPVDVAHIGGRTVAILNLNGQMVPFYISTGRGGKEKYGVAAGKWYPFFGYSMNRGGAAPGWLNKGSGEMIAEYYGSDVLRRAAQFLDENVDVPEGDLLYGERGDAGRKYINSQLGITPLSYDELSHRFEALGENIRTVISKADPKWVSYRDRKAAAEAAAANIKTEEDLYAELDRIEKKKLADLFKKIDEAEERSPAQYEAADAYREALDEFKQVKNAPAGYVAIQGFIAKTINEINGIPTNKQAKDVSNARSKLAKLRDQYNKMYGRDLEEDSKLARAARTIEGSSKSGVLVTRDGVGSISVNEYRGGYDVTVSNYGNEGTNELNGEYSWGDENESGRYELLRSGADRSEFEVADEYIEEGSGVQATILIAATHKGGWAYGWELNVRRDDETVANPYEVPSYAMQPSADREYHGPDYGDFDSPSDAAAAGAVELIKRIQFESEDQKTIPAEKAIESIGRIVANTLSKNLGSDNFSFSADNRADVTSQAAKSVEKLRKVAETKKEPWSAGKKSVLERGHALKGNLPKKVLLPDGKELDVTYVVVDALNDIVPTHNPNNNFAKTPGADLNERPYEDPKSGKALRDNVLSIASNVKPDMMVNTDATAVSGPPVVTDKGIVLGGNARSMAAQLIYERAADIGADDADIENEKALYDSVARFAKANGISEEQLSEISSPIVVRVIKSGQEGKPGELSAALNENFTAARDTAARSASRGSRLTETSANEIARIMGDDASIRSTLDDPRKAAEIESLLVKDYVLTEKDLVEMKVNGKFTSAAKEEIERAIVGAIVDDIAVISQMQPKVSGLVVSSAGPLLKLMAADPRSKVSIRNAIDLLNYMASSDARFSELHSQAVLGDVMESQQWRNDKHAENIAKVLSLGKLKGRDAIRRVAAAAEQSASGQGDMFNPDFKVGDPANVARSSMSQEASAQKGAGLQQSKLLSPKEQISRARGDVSYEREQSGVVGFLNNVVTGGIDKFDAVRRVEKNVANAVVNHQKRYEAGQDLSEEIAPIYNPQTMNVSEMLDLYPGIIGERNRDAMAFRQEMVDAAKENNIPLTMAEGRKIGKISADEGLYASHAQEANESLLFDKMEAQYDKSDDGKANKKKLRSLRRKLSKELAKNDPDGDTIMQLEAEIEDELDLRDGAIQALVEDIRYRVKALKRDIAKKMADQKEMIDLGSKEAAAKLGQEILDMTFELDKIQPLTQLSGMSDEEASKILKTIEGSKEAKGHERIRKAMTGLQQMKLKIQQASGLVDANTIARWKRRYGDSYIPLKTTIRPPDGSSGGGGGGISVRGNESAARRGRMDYADDIIAHSLVDFAHANSRAARNMVSQTMMNLFRANRNSVNWTYIGDEKAMREAIASGLYTVRDKARIVTAKRTVNVFNRKGELIRERTMTEYAIVHSEDLARSIRQIDGIDLGNFTAAAVKGTRIFTKMQTAWNPAFILPNFARDVLLAMGIRYTDNGVKAAARMVKNLPSAIRTVMADEMRSAFGSKMKPGKFAAEYNELRNLGGFSSYVEYGNIKDQVRAFQNEIKGLPESKTGKFVAVPKSAVKSLAKLVETANTIVERATRLAAYVEMDQTMLEDARANGKDYALGSQKVRRAAAAKNLTVNFDRRGTAGPLLNGLYAFYNANVQGSANLLRRVGPNADARQRARMSAYIAALSIGGYAMSLLARSMSDDDENGEEAYKSVGTDELQKNAVLMIPGMGDKRFNMPLPWGANIAWFAGVQMERMMAGDINGVEAADQFSGALLSSFSPITGPTASMAVVPTLVRPFAEIDANINYQGNAIMPPVDPYDKTPLPDSRRSYRTVGKEWKLVAETLNDITGGSERKAGFVDVSPESLEHLSEFMMGGAGRFISNAFGMDLLKEDVQMKDIPVVGAVGGRFVKETPDTQRAVSEYYQNTNRLAALKEDLKDPETRRDALLDPAAKAIAMSTGFESKVRKIRKAEREAMDRGDEERAKRLETVRVKIMQEFNRRYNRLAGQSQ